MFKRYPKELRVYIVGLVQAGALEVAADRLIELLSAREGNELAQQVKSLHPTWTDEDKTYILVELTRAFRGKSAKPGRKQGRAYRQIVLERAKDRCEICGFYSPYTLEIHHIVTVEHGGHGYPKNLIALCGNCHDVIHALAPLIEDAGLMLTEPLKQMLLWIETTYSADKVMTFHAIADERAWFDESGLYIAPSIAEILNPAFEDDLVRTYALAALKLAAGSITPEEFEQASNAFVDAVKKRRSAN